MQNVFNSTKQNNNINVTIIHEMAYDTNFGPLSRTVQSYVLVPLHALDTGHRWQAIMLSRFCVISLLLSVHWFSCVSSSPSRSASLTSSGKATLLGSGRRSARNAGPRATMPKIMLVSPCMYFSCRQKRLSGYHLVTLSSKAKYQPTHYLTVVWWD